jgi:opacity protein-like surface antigen
MKKRLSMLLFVSTASFATVNQIDFNFGRGSPLSFIQADGSSDRAGSRGTSWSADFLHATGPGTYVGLGGGQFRSNDNVSQTFVPNTTSTIHTKSSTILILTRADMPTDTRLVPYLIAGLGWARNSLSVTAMSGQGTLLEDSHNTLAYATGLGLDYALNDRLFIGMEARYQGALKQTYDLTPQGQATTGVTSMQSSMNVFLWGVKAGFKY